MSIYKGHLDDLLNTAIPYADFQSVLVQSYTLTSANPALAQLSTVTASITAGQPLGIYSFAGPYTITAIDDTNNTFTANGNYAGLPYSVTYYALGFAGNSVFFGSRNSNTIAGYAASSLSQLDSNVGILSPTPGATGSVLTYSQGPAARVAPPVKLDFNGDGKSDLLLQNDNGAVVVETINGLSVSGGGLITNPGPSWHLVGSADFNGDGQNDILFQNDSGAIVDYLMNGTAITAGNLLANPGPSWHVRGTADFNNDGNADLVLQNDDGSIVIDYTNGTAVTGSVAVSGPGASWTVEAVADFNGDGQPDILLQNSNGALVDFLMNGATVAAGYQLIGPNTGYSVAGTGNYNGDKNADIVLHNDDGSNLILYTNGQSVIGTASPIGNPGPTWNTVVPGIDFNGDGTSDLLFENTAGALVGFTLNASGAVTASKILTTTAGAGWRAAGGPPMQFIDGTGAAPTLAATPGVDEFNFTTFTPGVHTITNFDAAIDLIALSATSVGSYANVQPHESAYNGGTAIGLSATTAIVIQGIAPTQLSAANFVFR